MLKGRRTSLLYGKALEEQLRKLNERDKYGPATPEERDLMDKAGVLMKMYDIHSAPHYEQPLAQAFAPFRFWYHGKLYRYTTAENLYKGVHRLIKKLQERAQD